MPGVRTAKKGLEGIEKVVYVAGYACASPHGVAPVSIGVWRPSNIHRSPCFSSVFWAYAHSGDLAPATFEDVRSWCLQATARDDLWDPCHGDDSARTQTWEKEGVNHA